MVTLTTGAVIGLGLLLVGSIWRITDDDHIKREQEKEIESLRKKVDDLENNRGRFDRVVNRLDDKLEELTRKMNDKF